MPYVPENISVMINERELGTHWYCGKDTGSCGCVLTCRVGWQCFLHLLEDCCPLQRVSALWATSLTPSGYYGAATGNHWNGSADCAHIQIICAHPQPNDRKPPAAPILDWPGDSENFPCAFGISPCFLSEGEAKHLSRFGRNLNLNFSLSTYIFLFGSCVTWASLDETFNYFKSCPPRH